MSWHPRRRRDALGSHWFWYLGPLEVDWFQGRRWPLRERFHLRCGPFSVELGWMSVHLGFDR